MTMCQSTRCVLISTLFPMLPISVGCGEGVADMNYRGEPILRVSGQVAVGDSIDVPNVSERESLQIALFWSIRGDNEIRFVRHEHGVVARGSFPAKYEMDIFSPPPPEAVWQFGRTRNGAEGKVAIGTLLIFDDQNGNTMWDRDDEPLAGSALYDTVVYWAEDSIDIDEGSWNIPKGFSVDYLLAGDCAEPANGLDESAFEQTFNDTFHDAQLEYYEDGVFSVPEDGELAVDLMVAGWDLSLSTDLDCDGMLVDWSPCNASALKRCENEAKATGTDLESVCPDYVYLCTVSDCSPDDLVWCSVAAQEEGLDPAFVCGEYLGCSFE